MDKNNIYIDRDDPISLHALLDAFDAWGTEHEEPIRTALSIHNRAFMLHVEPVSEQALSPLEDAFTFNMDTDELTIFSDNPATLVDALLEMAMFMRGFNTLLGVEDEWKIQVAIGAWRHVRQNLKLKYHLIPAVEKLWSATLDEETVQDFDPLSFAAMVFLAGRSDLDVVFPEGANVQVITAYRRLARIIETVAYDIDIDDFVKFNRRLSRAIQWIEETILPQSSGPSFDDLMDSDSFFDSFSDDLLS